MKVSKNTQTLFNRVKLIIAIICVVLLTVTMANSRNMATSADTIIAKEILSNKKAMNEGDDDIDFNAFFLRDTDGDGYAENINEIDQDLGNSDYMFVELNVKSIGQLKNAKLKIQNSNFKWKTAIISNNIIRILHHIFFYHLLD